jgi:hypothetical protein
MWSNLNEFAEWYKTNNHPFKPPTTDPIYKTDHSLSAVIYREGRYQVELYYIKPNWITTELTVPGIEYSTLFLSGTISVQSNGQTIYNTDSLGQPNESGLHPLYGMVFSNVVGQADSVEYGPKGACVMVLQKWDEGILMTSMSKQKELIIN